MCPPSLSTHSPSIPLPSFPAIPPTPLSQSAYNHASSLLDPSILAHSLRLYIYALTLAKSSHSIYATDPLKHDILFTACLFHDIGTSETYNGPQRFEVEGADAAVKFLASFGIGEEDKSEVWKAIALHTSKGIVERMGELPALMRRGLDVEFGVGSWTAMEGVEDVVGLKREVEGRIPREDIEKVLGDAVVKQAVVRVAKAPGGSWPGDLVRAWREDPGWEGVNRGF